MLFRLPNNLMLTFLIALTIGCTSLAAPQLSFAIETKVSGVEESLDKNPEEIAKALSVEREVAIEAEIESEVISEFSVDSPDIGITESGVLDDEVQVVTEADVALMTDERTLTQKLMPTYGNWCGANHPKDMDTADDPIDLLDQACKTHDYCYANEGYLNCSCDNTLNQELITGLHEKKFKPTEAIYARSVHLYFNGSPCNGDHSTKVAPSRLVHNVVKKVGNDTVNVLKSLPIIGSKISSNNNVETSNNDEASENVENSSEADINGQE